MNVGELSPCATARPLTASKARDRPTARRRRGLGPECKWLTSRKLCVHHAENHHGHRKGDVCSTTMLRLEQETAAPHRHSAWPRFPGDAASDVRDDRPFVADPHRTSATVPPLNLRRRVVGRGHDTASLQYDFLWAGSACPSASGSAARRLGVRPAANAGATSSPSNSSASASARAERSAYNGWSTSSTRPACLLSRRAHCRRTRALEVTSDIRPKCCDVGSSPASPASTAGAVPFMENHIFGNARSSATAAGHRQKFFFVLIKKRLALS